MNRGSPQAEKHKLNLATTALWNLGEISGRPLSRREMFNQTVDEADRERSWQLRFLKRLVELGLVSLIKGKHTWDQAYIAVDAKALREISSDLEAVSRIIWPTKAIEPAPTPEPVTDTEFVPGIHGSENTQTPGDLNEALAQMQHLTLENAIFIRDLLIKLDQKFDRILKALGEKP